MEFDCPNKFSVVYKKAREMDRLGSLILVNSTGGWFSPVSSPI